MGERAIIYLIIKVDPTKNIDIFLFNVRFIFHNLYYHQNEDVNKLIQI